MSAKNDEREEIFETNDEICQKLVEEFVQLTKTDEALAQFYLQDRNWNLRLSVNDFFENISKQASKATKRKSDAIDISSDESNEENDCHIIFDGKADQNDVSVDNTSATTDQKVVTNIKEFRMICWNIDGIDEKNIVIRTEAVSRIIVEENALIVFLQEVIPQSESILRRTLPDYQFFSGNTDSVDYYTLTAIHKKYVKLEDNQIIDFPNTSMGRNLLKTTVRIGGTLVCLMNTHLESTKDFAEERINQLNQIFRCISKTSNNETIIFGGDLNLRDKELANQSFGGIPRGVYDVWIKTGARRELEFTWDLTRNDNLQFMGSPFKPRFRFDRVFVKPSLPTKVSATHFGLLGLQRLKPHVCFPSDHWGLRIQFRID